MLKLQDLGESNLGGLGSPEGWGGTPSWGGRIKAGGVEGRYTLWLG